MDESLPLKTERLELRRLEQDDVEPLFSIFGDQENARFQFWSPWSLEQVQEFVTSQQEIHLGDPGVPFVFGVVEASSHRFIGTVDLTINSIEDRQGEIGFTFNSEFTGRGFATEAVHAALGYGFSTMELHRIFAGVDTRNERSWKLMQRVGMRREAHFIHANLEDDTWVDDYTYAMLDHEWQSRSGEGTN